MDEYRPRILSLDGGGVRGWSQILLLERIIYAIKVEENRDRANPTLPSDKEMYPCDYFDVIIGTGTGAINAILIGRLELSIYQMKQAYRDLKNKLLGKEEKDEKKKERVILTAGSPSNTASNGPKGKGIDDKQDSDDGDGEVVEDGVHGGLEPLFDHIRLKKWAKELVDPNTFMKRNPTDESSRRNDENRLNKEPCKVCVTALRAKNKSLPALFRSYRSRSISAPDCQIWKVIRATTASPFLFRPITISGGISASTKQTFIAAEEGANNPIKYMKTEYDEIYKKTRPRPPQPGIIVSLGTGKLRGITLEGYTADHKDAEQMMNNVLRQLEKDCEQAHEDFAKGYPRGRNDDGEIIYFRFNVEQGMQDIMDSDWDQDKRIVTETNTHMDTEGYDVQFRELAMRFVSLADEERKRDDENDQSEKH